MSTKRVAIWALVMFAGAHVVAAEGDTPLVDAVKRADTPRVRALLLKHIDVNAPEADGMTALHWAAQRDDVDVAGLLIRGGANPKAVTRYGVMPLALACINGSATCSTSETNTSSPDPGTTGRLTVNPSPPAEPTSEAGPVPG